VNNQLTIIIPCKNEGKGVINVIKLITNQIDCKIIVADSSDDIITPLLLTKCQKQYPQIQVINGGLPAVARNNGAKLVNTPYILFLDADMYIKSPNLIRTVLRKTIKGNYDLTTCKVKSLYGDYNWVWNIFSVIQWFSSITKPFALGGFMLFKTETFNKLGGFNEQDKVAEDYHLSSKIKSKKFKIFNYPVYTPSRRFEKKGIWYMVKLMWKSWINKNNPDFFKNDQNYWK
jgi:glycosyltransferase involved in cell wall biosynthesis